MAKKKFKINLLCRILLAIVLGIGCGFILPAGIGRVFITFNALFSQFLGFVIPLVILGLVAPAIAEIGKGAGKMLLTTVGIAYVATMASGFFSFFVGNAAFPALINPGELSAEIGNAAGLTPYFTLDVPPLFGVMSALVMAFILGIALASMKGGDTLRSALNDFRDIVTGTIRNAIVPLLPFYIFGIFMNMTVSGHVGAILGSFAKVIGVIAAIHVALLLTQFCIAAAVARRNPFRLLGTMLPAYLTALGTQSSAATIPVTLRQTIKMGVREDIAGFVVPLCATIHMSGSIMKLTCASLAMMIMLGMPYDLPMFAGFIAMLGISIVAAPGVPGGAIMASLGLMSGMLGFSDANLALIIAIYIAMDSLGTACNVTGDGFIAIIIDKIFGGKKSLHSPIDSPEEERVDSDMAA